MSESDGIEEAIEGRSRVGMTVAGRLCEKLARARERAPAPRPGRQRISGPRELQARFDADRAAARVQLAPVLDNRWWDTASGRDVESARGGHRVEGPRPDDASVAAAWAKVEWDREQAD